MQLLIMQCWWWAGAVPWPVGPARVTALTPAQAGLQVVQSRISVQGRKTIKVKETLCILVRLHYLVARELGVLPKSRSLFHSAGVQYWPVHLLPCNLLFHSSSKIFWKWQWIGGKFNNENCRY